ncbi:hypothetical protein BDY24DRAFT_395129 [Mrakia frigida]|uniref:uncharacterized protein n=1 Tax=Mrakia frigida TaxID=29902 RepID=UPI003FCC00B8
MAKKKSSSLKQKAQNLFTTSPGGTVTKTVPLPPPKPKVAASLVVPGGMTAEEMAEAEREQEEEDLAELKQMEEEDLKRRAEGIKLIERAAAKAEESSNKGEGASNGKKKSSKDRFKDREAKKKEAHLASLPPTNEAIDAAILREKLFERDSLKATCKALDLDIHEISADGHCLYAAVADQLFLLGIIKENNYALARNAAADYILSHQDDFLPFLPSASGEDGDGAEEDGMMTPEGMAEYCRRIKESGEWGGEPEILALSRAFNIPIHVIQVGPPTIVAHSPDPDAKGALKPKEAKEIRACKITFHTRMYGLGAHYNSLRKHTGGTHFGAFMG